MDETKTICSIQGFSISGIYSGLELDQETLASPLRGGEIMVNIFFLETFTSFSKVWSKRCLKKKKWGKWRIFITLRAYLDYPLKCFEHIISVLYQWKKKKRSAFIHYLVIWTVKLVMDCQLHGFYRKHFLHNSKLPGL